MARLGDIPGRLYRGEISVNIVSRQRMWYALSGLILIVSVAALLIRGLNFSVEFKGGSVFEFPAQGTSSAAISKVISGSGGGSSSVQFVGGSVKQWEATTGQLPSKVSDAVQAALTNAFHIPANKLAVQFVGPSWGSSITSKAIEALIIFMIVIVIYLSIAFEWKMAAAAFVALLHDILITVGVYALVGFTVSPTSVIGLVTILGYSLYDTVVVFDKVRENTAGLITSERSTYSQAANLALNQTLVRSINTSLTALIPVACILFIGGALLGTGTLNDLALVLFVGMLSGAYSSLFIATPVLADLKEREPAMKKLAERVSRRQAGGRAAVRRAAEGGGAAGSGAAGSGAASSGAGTPEAPAEEAADDRDSIDDAATSEASATQGGEVTVSPSSSGPAGPAGSGSGQAPGQASGAGSPGPSASRVTVRQQQARRPSGGQRKKRR
ncbi:MAG TPA: protein translocase subunit SecF [Trebonia sp.]|jgi:preprotein translocase subunit SecF|nr:protein translocase subunit SecF [Trebonia sp.]